jgi:hypothetical protein
LVSIIATAVQHMMAAGMDQAAIVAAVADMEAQITPPRSKGAVRQARYVERQKASQMTENDVCDDNDAPALSLDKKPPDPKKLNPIPSVCETRARAGDYHRLPEGWEPRKPLPPKTQAKVDQWPPGALGEELAALHRWAANAKNEAGKGRKKDWDAAWVNWIERRHDERYGRERTNGMGRHQPSDGLSATTRAARDVFGIAAGHS